MIVLDLEIRQAIAQVQQGDENVRENLIKKYIPFILKVTSQVCKRFVRMGEDDEVSIALLAFNEALAKYDCHQATSFFSFAQSVMKRRMIDYFRKNSGNKEIPWSSVGNENGEENDSVNQLDRLTWQNSQIKFFEDDIRELRREEILEYQKKLQEYGISLRELVEVSPKHQDARMAAYEVARIIAHNSRFRDYLGRTRSLPLKELEHEVRVSRKTLERQRKYIIALAVILTGEYYFLDEYVEGLRG